MQKLRTVYVPRTKRMNRTRKHRWLPEYIACCCCCCWPADRVSPFCDARNPDSATLSTRGSGTGSRNSLRMSETGLKLSERPRVCLPCSSFCLLTRSLAASAQWEGGRKGLACHTNTHVGTEWCTPLHVPVKWFQIPNCIDYWFYTPVISFSQFVGFSCEDIFSCMKPRCLK